MNEVNIQLAQSNAYTTRLEEQFERIDKEIEAGKTVTLVLTDNGHSISLKIERDSVVESDAKDVTGETLKARLPTEKDRLAANDSLVAHVTNRFSYDLGDINRQVTSGYINAKINRPLAKKTDDELKLRSSSPNTKATSSGLPDPAVTYHDDTWILAGDCAYTTNDGFTITAMRGFKTDLASIPRIFWPLVSSFELSLPAPIFHDLIYRSAGEVAPPDGEVVPADKTFTRLEADDIFLELMVRAHIGFWRRTAAYVAVRHFAESSWRKRVD